MNGLSYLIDCFKSVFDCVGGSGPQGAPEMNAASGVTAIALLLCIAAVVYRRLQQEQI